MNRRISAWLLVAALVSACQPAVQAIGPLPVQSRRMGAVVGPGVQVITLPIPSSGTSTPVNVYGKAILGYHLNGLPGATSITIQGSDESIVVNNPMLFDACVVNNSNSTVLSASGWYIPLVQRLSYIQVLVVSGNPSAATLTVSLADF